MLKFILPLLILAGCATSAKNFTQAGVTPEQKATDGEYCKAYATGARGPLPDYGLIGLTETRDRYNALFKMCMMDRGYKAS